MASVILVVYLRHGHSTMKRRPGEFAHLNHVCDSVGRRSASRMNSGTHNHSSIASTSTPALATITVTPIRTLVDSRSRSRNQFIQTCRFCSTHSQAAAWRSCVATMREVPLLRFKKKASCNLGLAALQASQGKWHTSPGTFFVGTAQARWSGSWANGQFPAKGDGLAGQNSSP